MPESVLFLINNYKISFIFSSKIYSFYSNAFKEALGSKNGAYAQKCLNALNKFQEALDTNPNLSLSNDFRVSFRVLSSLLKQPEKHNIYSHLFMAMTTEADFYISSKLLLNKTKKYYESIPDSDRSNILQISTFQGIFETYIRLELRDIAYGSKKFDFYIVDEGINEWDKIEHITPQNIGAEYFGFKQKKGIIKRNKMLKFYGLTKFGKRRVKKRRINKSLLENIENPQRNYLEPLTNIEPSYIEVAKFDQINWLYQRLVDLEVQAKPLIFLDSSLIFQLLLNFENNGKKLPSEFIEQISNQYEFVCLPGVLFDLEKAGYTEFVRDLLKNIINLPKLLEIEKFIVNYQNKLDEYGFSNLNIEILSDSVYWSFYVQFHSCIAKILNADTIIIPSDLRKHYLNKNCYNGKFSFFVDSEVKPTLLKCVTAKKFWKKLKLEKQKAESDNLKIFVVSSNFKEWEVPVCLGAILKELDRKSIKDVNTFWLDIFRIGENQVENKKYFKEFVELVKKFEETANILKDIPQLSSLIDKNMHSRTNFSDINNYTRKIKRVFAYLIEVNKNGSFFNSNELYSIVLLFKSNVSNFLKDKFFLKAKFKSPALPTTINFDLFHKDGDIRYELSSIIPTRYRSNTLQKNTINIKVKNKSSIQFEPKLQRNDEFIIQLFRKFLFKNYCFHKNELETVYRDFLKFIKAKKEYRAIAKEVSFNRFESLIFNNQERSLVILLEPHGIYYSKLFENFLILIETYHSIHDNSLSLERSAKILNIKESELEFLVYSLIQDSRMFREKSAPHPKYSLFLQAIKELNYKSTTVSQAITYNPYWFPKKKNKIVLHQPDLWIESESKILENTPIYYINKKNRVSYSDKTFNVQIKGETFSADVDTGAFKSLISKDIAERLFPKQKRYKAYVSGYTQHTKHVDMIREVPFHYNGQEFTDDFLIEENLEKIFKAEVVIGRGGYNKMLVRYYGKTLENLFEAKDSEPDNNEKVKVNNYIPNLDKKEGEVATYNTLELIEDLRTEIQQFSEELATLFPERVKKYTHRKLSVLLNFGQRYITGALQKFKKDPSFEIYDKAEALLLLRAELEERLGDKALGCVQIIKRYQDNEISMFQFVDLIEDELGRVSGEIEVTDYEIGLILAGQKEYIKEIIGIIRSSTNRRYNPQWKFNKERLYLFKDFLFDIYGDRAKKCFDMLQKYVDLNNDLKDYPHQQYKITKPNFFQNIESKIDASYWFGFLSADGSLGSKDNRLSFELSAKDKERLEDFAMAVGFPLDRIKLRIRSKWYNQKLKSYESATVRFICAPMAEQIRKLGFQSSKAERKSLPNYVVETLKEAKKLSKQTNLDWWLTKPGKVALAFLLGFYDGDGGYRGGRSAVIYSSSKQFLEQVKELFEIEFDVREDKSPGEEIWVFDESYISKGFYSLTLGSRLFDMIMNSYKDSMPRKRPDDLGKSLSFLGDQI